MNPAEFLEQLSRRGVQLWVEGERLRYRAPQGVLTPALLDKLRKHKAEFLKLLDTSSPPQTAERRGDTPCAGPLSHGQQALWFLHRTAPDSAAYNVAFTARIRSEVDRQALNRAYRTLLGRHSSLCTAFPTRDGQPVREVHSHHDICLEEIDASAWSWQQLNQRVVEAYGRPFDLQRGPVVRLSLFTRSPHDHVLLLTIHHVACDGWSLWIIQDEFRQLYAAETSGKPAALPELQPTYSGFVDWQSKMLASPSGEMHWSYWQEQLSGELPVLNLPTDRPRPPMRSYRGASCPFRLNEELTRRLRELAQSEGATLYMLLLAAFQVLLHRYTSQEEVLIGSPTTGRGQTEYAGVVGYFINSVVMRGDLSGDPTLRSHLARVRQTVLGALKHQDYPLSLLIERLKPNRDPSRSPLFQVFFASQRPQLFSAVVDLLPAGEKDISVDWGGLKFEPFQMAQEEGQFDLSLEVVEASRSLPGVFKYNTDLFEPGTIDRMSDHFQNLLAEIVANPDKPVSRLSFLSEAERRQLLEEFNDTDADYPSLTCIHQAFQEQAQARPQAVALEFEDREVTYAELDARANRLAQYLRKLDVGPGVLVGVCLERSVEEIVGLLGILKAGGAYLPLDAECPKQRLSFMLDDTQAPVILTSSRSAEALPEYRGKVIRLDADWETIAGQPDSPPVDETGPDDLAYVMYTSGSTGKPKGVGVVHRGIVRLVKGVSYVDLGPEETFMRLSPLSFDASTFELWASLLGGGKLVIFPPQLPSVGRLGRFIQQSGVTTLFLTTALFHQQVDFDLKHLSGVRQLLTGGESLCPARARKALSRLDGCRLINCYGPTENSAFTSRHVMTSPEQVGQSVSIGRPVPNTRVYVLDRHLEPVPIGVPGELCTSGDGLARGYLNRPELTAERFVPDPFCGDNGGLLYKTGDLARWLPDGRLEFLGRVDHQVKVRGFRIELGEIESVLPQHEAVREAVVQAHEDATGQKQLVAYVVANGNGSFALEELRGFLQGRLPKYMVPSLFVKMDALPRTTGGKVDRKALPEPDGARPELEKPYLAPRTENERVLAEIWSEVLGIDRVGVHDNFFELGGASLKSLRIVAKAEEAGLAIPPELLTPELLFERPTIAELAQLIDTPKIPHDESHSPQAAIYSEER